MRHRMRFPLLEKRAERGEKFTGQAFVRHDRAVARDAAA